MSDVLERVRRHGRNKISRQLIWIGVAFAALILVSLPLSHMLVSMVQLKFDPERAHIRDWLDRQCEDGYRIVSHSHRVNEKGQSVHVVVSREVMDSGPFGKWEKKVTRSFIFYGEGKFGVRLGSW